ncbi:D-hexose-6-phosphate mutarotase [Rheinheimera maricola]|uniref:Putative glucose-6-phosphate 1-epimerase n=1 Tax=Rheinheimera maricola TaxID=2793282 RepID=A0ABS7X5W3_9GAMM|nr:D-hexose-6-phosphate mutarotase [Rheinheimera maricola]MBZ9610938.1 D-hexose-6-phosphate mutarotase [Rheinheimera maricola]
MPRASISQQTGFAHLTDLPCIKLQYGAASAVISLYGGQVLSYQPQPDTELLWVSPLASWQQHTPIRGGVPVCWPWFGAVAPELNPQQQPLPNHGVVRTKLWQLSGQTQRPAGVSVTLAVTLDDLAFYQGSVTLTLCVELADTLSITLHCSTAMLQQAALHSYFAVENISQAAVQPLPLTYLDKLSGGMVQSDSSCAVFNAEVDRIYPQAGETLRLQHAHGDIAIRQSGHDAAVVWNPWRDKSRQAADLADDSYQQFVCVETARLQLHDAAELTLVQQLRRL